MISTLQIKQQQLMEGYFTVGSGSEVILVMGSCRVCPYVQYLHDWNEANGNRFTIHSIDPFNWNWNINDDRVEYSAKLKELETDERLLSMLKSVNIFIHEYYANAGMFNVHKEGIQIKDSAIKNIYKFGMKPQIDICIPNWNDYFILFGDIVSFDLGIRKKAIQDYNVIGKLTEQTKSEIFEISQKNLLKFYDVCKKSDLPVMQYYFEKYFRQKRMWWTYNHVSKNFTIAIFRFMNEKFLFLDLSKGFDENHVDMFGNNFTKLTEYDIMSYNYTWEKETIIEFKEKIF